MRQISMIVLIMLCAIFGQALSAAEPWPNRPVKILVPYSAGSVTDVSARYVAERLGNGLGQPVFVENRPGASGSIGLAAGIASPPDGYTIFLASTSNLAVAPAMGASGRFDPVRDFIPVAPYSTRTPLVMVAHPSLGISTLKDLVRLAKERPDRLQYATGGRTTTAHFVGEVLQRAAGIELDHVPFKGSTPALLAVIAGEVPLGLDFPETSAAHVRAGKVKALFVSSHEPVPLLQGVQTATQAGYPDLDIAAWAGFFLPAGTPKPIVDRLHAEFAKVLGTPEAQARLVAVGSELRMMSPEEFRAFIRADQQRWVQIVTKTGVKAE